jgi:hypothetical protein
MSERGTFPWTPALAASALLGLCLLTVTIRAHAVHDGEELMGREHVRLSLRRHARDLSLQLLQTSQTLGASERAATGAQAGPQPAPRKTRS